MEATLTSYAMGSDEHHTHTERERSALLETESVQRMQTPPSPVWAPCRCHAVRSRDRRGGGEVRSAPNDLGTFMELFSAGD